MWRRKLEQLESEGRRVVLWGAGSKGVTFLNAFKHCGQIEFAVDINPRKQGLYVPGTGQKIVAPEFLKDYQPDVVLVMNPLYMAEIQKLAKKLKLLAKLMDASGTRFTDRSIRKRKSKAEKRACSLFQDAKPRKFWNQKSIDR
jgi:hypothetical protein